MRYLLMVCLLSLASPQSASAQRPSRPAADLLVGAIRWDNWYPGSPHNKILAATPERLPFFATGSGDEARILGGTRATMAAENLYARAAGIDYWLFSYYAPTGSFGRAAERMRRLNGALDSFRALPDRSGMRFAVILQQTYPASDFDRLVAMLAPMLADRDYIRAPDGRASLFVDLPQWERTLGDTAKVQDFFLRLRDALSRRSGAQVRLTALTWQLREVPKHVGPGKAFAAFSTYALAPPNQGQVYAPAQCAAFGANFWKRALALDLAFVPNVTLGWDYRPILRFPDQLYDRSKNPGTCQPASEADWRAQIAAARQAAAAGARDGTVPGLLLYAWNELAEGGWLVPTRSEGVRRIAALARALGRTGRIPREATLTFPDDGDPHTPDAWPCPPGMRVATDGAARPDAEMQGLHAGRWTRRVCRRAG